MKAFQVDQAGVGAEFRRAREFLHLSIHRLARISGVAASHIWNLEQGKGAMSLERFFVLCSHLGLPASQLLSDNIRVDQGFFAQQALDELQAAAGAGPKEAKLQWFLVAYISAASVVVCYLLLTPGSEMGGGHFDYPSKGLADAFLTVAVRLRTDVGLKERQQYLLEIQKQPAAVLSKLGLMSEELIREFGEALSQRKKDAAGKGFWHPTPSKAMESIYQSRGFLERFDPRAFGAVMRELSAKQLEAALPLVSPKTERKPRKKPAAKRGA